MRGITEERLLNILNHSRTGDIAVIVIQSLISNECKELTPWLPIDENTPNDREVLLYYPGMLRSNNKVIGYAFERNVSTMHGVPTHYQELPDDPKWQ